MISILALLPLLLLSLHSPAVTAQTAGDTSIFGSGFPPTCTAWCSFWEQERNVCVGSATQQEKVDCLCEDQTTLDWISCWSCINSLADPSSEAWQFASSETSGYEESCGGGDGLVPAYPVTSGTTPTTRTLAADATATGAATATGDATSIPEPTIAPPPTFNGFNSTFSQSTVTGPRAGGPDEATTTSKSASATPTLRSGDGSGSGSGSGDAAADLRVGMVGFALMGVGLMGGALLI